MKKSLFEDQFSHIQENVVAKSLSTSESPTIETSWVDQRTGAEYLVKENRPTGPQGDFRIPKNDSNDYFRTVMGLPTAGQFSARPLDNPFEEREPEPMPVSIEDSLKERSLQDTKRFLMFQPTSEPLEDEIQDFGTYTINSKGQIKDKPMNTEGPHGKIADVSDLYKTKLSSESKTSKPSNREVAQVPKKSAPLDILEERLESKRGLQILLNSAYRGLFGSQVADHIITKSLNDTRETFDRPIISRVIMQAGLMKPWVPSDKSDRFKKPDATAMDIGKRAIQTLLKGPLAPDIQDLPRAERDDLTLAIGRTILNSMSIMPEGAKQRPDFEDSQKMDLKKSIFLNLTPSIFAGILQPDAIDKFKREEKTQSRTGGVSTSSFAVVERSRINSLREEPEFTSRSIANINRGLTKKNLWSVEESPEVEAAKVPQMQQTVRQFNTSRSTLNVPDETETFHREHSVRFQF